MDTVWLKQIVTEDWNTCTIERKCVSGWKQMVSTNKRVHLVNEPRRSDWNAPNSSSESMGNGSPMVDKSLKLTCSKTKQLIEANELSQLICAKKLLKWYLNHAVDYDYLRKIPHLFNFSVFLQWLHQNNITSEEMPAVSSAALEAKFFVVDI